MLCSRFEVSFFFENVCQVVVDLGVAGDSFEARPEIWKFRKIITSLMKLTTQEHTGH
jgi:hypothetical protein